MQLSFRWMLNLHSSARPMHPVCILDADVEYELESTLDPSCNNSYCGSVPDSQPDCVPESEADSELESEVILEHYTSRLTSRHASRQPGAAMPPPARIGPCHSTVARMRSRYRS